LDGVKTTVTIASSAVAGTVQSGASSVAGAVQSGASSVAGAVQNGASAVAHGTQYVASTAINGVQDVYIHADAVAEGAFGSEYHADIPPLELDVKLIASLADGSKPLKGILLDLLRALESTAKLYDDAAKPIRKRHCRGQLLVIAPSSGL
jgi:hypothetical protein